MNRLGYCCICLGINEGKRKKDFITVNRGMVKKTFLQKGLSYVSELSILNLNDLIKILYYNIENNIYVYRMSSDMFPWLSEYELSELPNYNKIESLLKKIGKIIKDNNIRTSFHPGPFNVLASENISVVNKTINELNKHSEIMDIMELDESTLYPINIHINTTKPSREAAAERFVNNFNSLSESCKKRLTLENDDSPNQYSVKILYDLVYSKIGIPIVFDQHHYNYGPKDQSMEESLRLAISTWKTRALTHMSSPKTIEDKGARETAHADYIYEEIQTFGLEFDTEVEAKAKDLAVIKILKS